MMNTSLDEIRTTLGSLHDNVLLTVELRWAEGFVAVDVRTADGVRRIVVHDVTRVVCPRENPWGRSVCINDVRFVALQSGSGFQMEVEMQSGDRLLICGSALSVNALD
jgi:hypothetical protein